MAKTSQTLAFKNYVIATALAWTGAYLLVLTLNCLVDPLWYFRGNQLTNKNFAFNERQAKLNQLLRAAKQYDCLIFGSSRATLLPASSFRGYRCFNLSFSGGQIEEFIAFAEYLKHVGMRPRLIIVGVDGFNFLSSGRDAPNIPEYVRGKQPPPMFLKTYLSIDSLRMSVRTLLDRSPMPRYYNHHFEVEIRPDAPQFNPDKSLEAEGRKRTDAVDRRKVGYRLDNIELYRKLILLFPEATSIGYVPPISAWHIGDMEKHGVLNGYISALFRVAPIFSQFVDFSLPSAITSRTDVTYDGSHYHPTINNLISNALQDSRQAVGGINPKQISFANYTQQYQIALETLRRMPSSTRPSHVQHD